MPCITFACCIRLLTIGQLWLLHPSSIACLQGSVQMLLAAATLLAPENLLF